MNSPHLNEASLATPPSPGSGEPPKGSRPIWIVVSGSAAALVAAFVNGNTEAISFHGSVGGILALGLAAAAVVAVIRRPEPPNK
jgi:hypothetical protein